jgi:gliding motility-associated-like protein
VSNTSSTSSFVSPSTNTLYTLTVIDENGCEVSDQITIVVLSTRKFYAPNVFSPNGDNINDYFSLQIGQGIKAIKSVQIFDRWGNKVYNLENPVIDAEVIDTWDGRFGKDGDLMNPAVFVYFAEVLFDDGTTIVYRGNLTLMR